MVYFPQERFPWPRAFATPTASSAVETEQLSPPADSRDLQRDARRQQKAALRQRAAGLALEGYAAREIADLLGVSRRSVDRWLSAPREEGLAKASEGVGQMLAVARARCDTTYREAMAAWWESCLVAKESGEADDDSRRKPVFLARAADAVRAACTLYR